MPKHCRKKDRGGFTLVELLCVLGMAAVVIALAVPLWLYSQARMQLRINRANVLTVRDQAIIEVQTSLSEEDAATPDGRRVNEGLAENAGWVGVAQVDEGHVMTNLKLYVVDDIAAYCDGIAPRIEEKPMLPGDDAFYPEPAADHVWAPFATVKPEGYARTVYTVQVAVQHLDIVEP